MDYIGMLIAISGISIPSFWLGLMLIQWFAVDLRWLPTSGLGSWKGYILPSLTILGPNVADVFTGSFIIESIFSIPGLGSYYITSVTDRDFPMIIGSTMFYTGVYILSLLIVDILYVIIDPRIRLAGND